MCAARPVAAFAAHVPLRDAMIADIEIDGVAAIAERARGSLHIVGRVERRPPIGIVRDEIRAPNAIGDVPLGGLGIIIIPDFGEIALLPDAAVDEPNVIAREFLNCVRCQIGKNNFRMLARVANHVSHGRLLPARIDIGVAGLAGARAHVTRRELRLAWWLRPLRRRLLAAQLHRI